MASRWLTLLCIVSLSLFACDSDDSSNSSDNRDGLSLTSVCPGGSVPATGAGTLVISVNEEIDPCSASGTVVGTDILGSVATDGTLIFENVPIGT